MTPITNLLEDIPDEERLRVYKLALQFYVNKTEQKEKVDISWIDGLCLVLPCLMWGNYNYCDVAPDGKEWDYNSTPKAFPEMDDAINKLIKGGFKPEIEYDIRINGLKAAIDLLTNKLKTS